MRTHAARALSLSACLLGALMLAAQVSVAEEAPFDGKTCFCLENPQTKQFQSGCTGARYGQDFYVTAMCKGEAREGAPTEITVAPPWSVIASGKPRCEPCRVEPLPLPTGNDARGAESRGLQPVRSYLHASDIPPPIVAAYGVVALRAKPTPANRDRLLMACRAYVAHLPRQETLPPSVPLSDQMMTIWPLDQPEAEGAKKDDCSFVLDHYDLYGGISAIQDAERQGTRLDGNGPFLIGWSPSSARGVRDKVVLIVDMSPFNSQASFDAAFLFWQRKVVQDPELWRSGFALERVRLAIRDFVDHYGADILDAVKLAGGKG